MTVETNSRPAGRARADELTSSSGFDCNSDNYVSEVESAIRFAGTGLDHYTREKARLLWSLIDGRLVTATTRALSILDVGCGIGLIHPMMISGRSSLFGVDVAEQPLHKASAAHPAARYVKYDGSVLPFHDATFDVTYTICVLHHVPMGRWAEFMQEMYRVTRPGGLVCVIEHNPLNPLTRLVVNRCEFDRDAVLLWPWKLKSIFAEIGLRHASIAHFLFFPSDAPWFRSIANRLTWLPLGAQYCVSALRS